MKKLNLTLVLLFVLILAAKADLGNCVVYYGKFYMKNGRQFTGCVERWTEDVRLEENYSDRFCSDTGMMSLIKILSQETYRMTPVFSNGRTVYKLRVYKNMQYLSPRPLRDRQYDENPVYGFLTENDVELILPSELHHIVFWSAEYSKRYWLTSEIVVGNAEMIDTVAQQRYWNLVYVNEELHCVDEDPEWGYRLYNYNFRINTAELRRLADFKFRLLEPIQLEQDFCRQNKINPAGPFPADYQEKLEAFRQNRYQAIRMWFWERKILLVKVNGTC